MFVAAAVVLFHTNPNLFFPQISDDKLPDPEFGGGGFDGFGGEFGFEDMPSVSGLTAMESKLEEHRKGWFGVY